jgi:hypothetical protein
MTQQEKAETEHRKKRRRRLGDFVKHDIAAYYHVEFISVSKTTA